MDKKEILELVEKNINNSDNFINGIIGFIKNNNKEDFLINTDLSVKIFQGLCLRDEKKTIKAYNYLADISKNTGMEKIDGINKIHVVEDFVNDFINKNDKYNNDRNASFSSVLVELRGISNENKHKNKDYSYMNKCVNTKDYVMSHEPTNDDLDIAKIFSSEMLKSEQLDFIKYDSFVKNICFVSDFKNDIIDILNNCKIIKALEKTINDIQLSNSIDNTITSNEHKNTNFNKFKP